VVALELLRRGCELGYGLTADRQELDFVARHGDGSVQLVQVCADPGDPVTLERELRPLAEAMERYGATAVDLVVLVPPSGPLDLPAGVRLRPAAEWLLNPLPA
jgi:predicted AAA+ superfamily ATPase